LEDFSADYVGFLRRYIDYKKIRTKKFRVLVDPMHGAGDSFIGRILKGSDVRVEFIRETVNPTFGGRHPEPIEENLAQMIARMKKEKFDLGIALDGDADRIAAVAPGGVYINPQKILGLLTLHLHEDRKWTGGVVKTLCGTEMIDRIADDLGIKLYETPVGFKYISNLMEKEDIVAGGEEAGGMGVKNYIPERDGSLAGLLLLEMMVYRNKDILRILQDVEKKYGRYYYVREDLKVAKKVTVTRQDLPAELLGQRIESVKDHDGVKMICTDRSWLMLRASGTEPLVRLYAESTSLKKTHALLERGRDLVRAALTRS
jgi:phosphomannomutase